MKILLKKIFIFLRFILIKVFESNLDDFFVMYYIMIERKLFVYNYYFLV